MQKKKRIEIFNPTLLRFRIIEKPSLLQDSLYVCTIKALDGMMRPYLLVGTILSYGSRYWKITGYSLSVTPTVPLTYTLKLESVEYDSKFELYKKPVLSKKNVTPVKTFKAEQKLRDDLKRIIIKKYEKDIKE